MRVNHPGRIVVSLAIGALLGAAQPAEAQSPPSLAGRMAGFAKQRLRHVVAAARQMPEGEYDYRPAPGARTFGELVAHVANANRVFCSALGGSREPARPELEKDVPAKPVLLERLEASTAACEKALDGLTDASLATPLAFGGGALIDGTQIPISDTPAGMLVTLLASHAHGEYGKLTIYLRGKGLVPPTSQPRTQ